MQTTKISVLVCALAFSAAIVIRAADNPAQAAARAALAGKLFELDANTPPATNAVSPPMTKPAAAAPVVKAKPVVKEKPAAVAPDDSVVMTPINNKAAKAKAKADKAAAEAKARQDAEQAAADARAKKAEAKMVADKMAADQAAAKKAAAEKARADQAAALAKQESMPPVAAAPAAPALPEMKPIVAPPLPIPASKEQRLQELLVKYKADQVSPEEYQRERAAILAEP